MTGFSNIQDKENKIIAVSDADNRCTISKKVMVAQKMGAGGILIVLSIKVGTIKGCWKTMLKYMYISLNYLNLELINEQTLISRFELNYDNRFKQRCFNVY